MVEARNSEKETEWRNGPGSLWYDLASVPNNATSFDYGFKLSTKVITTKTDKLFVFSIARTKLFVFN